MTFHDLEPTVRAPTVEAYGAQWIERRHHLVSARTEASQLRLHVFPIIGHLELATFVRAISAT